MKRKLFLPEEEPLIRSRYNCGIGGSYGNQQWDPYDSRVCRFSHSSRKTGYLREYGDIFEDKIFGKPQGRNSEGLNMIIRSEAKKTISSRSEKKILYATK
jgi:hypothetical protein